MCFLYYHHYYYIVINIIIARPPFAKPPFANFRGALVEVWRRAADQRLADICINNGIYIYIYIYIYTTYSLGGLLSGSRIVKDSSLGVE